MQSHNETSISVVVVTHNRQKDIMETIKSLLNQSFTPFEIIIIDDGSSPPVKIDCKHKKLKIIRFNKEVGLSRARNHGIKISHGDYVAFIDDDAIADKDWLKEIQEGIQTGADILGGPIKPMFEVAPPEWWNEENFGGYAGVNNRERIWGCNMVIKKRYSEKSAYL